MQISIDCIENWDTTLRSTENAIKDEYDDRHTKTTFLARSINP